MRRVEDNLLATIRAKKETVRDVYRISTIYYEKRQEIRGRNKSTLVASSGRSPPPLMALKAKHANNSPT